MPLRRPETGLGEWPAATVREMDALEFLERSRDVAAEVVVAVAAPVRGTPKGS